MPSLPSSRMGANLTAVVTYLDELLETSSTPDYAGAVNGLQISNQGWVTKVAAAVDFSSATVLAAAAENANLLIVHHGMFWSERQPIVGNAYTRLRHLFEADIAVYASHLPLDRHPEFGNNVLLAKQLALEPTGQFARFHDMFIGVYGDSEIPTASIVERAKAFSREHGGQVVAAGSLDNQRTTRRWAICTGAGASAETLAEASQLGIDTLIVGEGPHWTAVEATERDLVIIYVGHYASETLGVYALAEDVSQKFQLGCVKISNPTGL